MTSARSRTAVAKEALDAMLDAQDITNEYGTAIKIYLRGETDVTRDKYNSIKEFDTAPDGLIETYAEPFTYSPTRNQMEKAGIHEQIDVLAYIATQDFVDAGYTYFDIDTVRSTVEGDGMTFAIKDKNQVSDYGVESIYIVLGLTKK